MDNATYSENLYHDGTANDVYFSFAIELFFFFGQTFAKNIKTTWQHG